MRNHRHELRQLRDSLHALVARGWDPADITTVELLEQLSAQVQAVADDLRNVQANAARIVAKFEGRAS